MDVNLEEQLLYKKAVQSAKTIFLMDTNILLDLWNQKYGNYELLTECICRKLVKCRYDLVNKGYGWVKFSVNKD